MKPTAVCGGKGELVVRIKMNDYERRWDNKSRRWVYKHREVMELTLGRKLLNDEHIHHKDGNPKNNALTNLELITKSEHMKIHSPVHKRLWRPVHAG